MRTCCVSDRFAAVAGMSTRAAHIDAAFYPRQHQRQRRRLTLSPGAALTRLRRSRLLRFSNSSAERRICMDNTTLIRIIAGALFVVVLIFLIKRGRTRVG